MKMISWNVNGLRSVYGSDFLGWLRSEDPDIVCLQEVKIHDHQLAFDMRNPPGYEGYFSFAEKSGYAGVAVYAKKPAKAEKRAIGFDRFDSEGRVLALDFGDFHVIDVYMPLGRPPQRNMGYKLDSYEKLFRFLDEYKNKPVVLVGDFNISHTEKDLAKPDANRNNVKFTKPEREKIDELLDLRFIDTFRELNPDDIGFSYWRYGGAKEQCGWRIDYCFASESLRDSVKEAFILEEVGGSDHRPVGIVW